MVVHNLDVRRIAVFPSEADAPLLIDPDAVLTFAVTLERFQLIRGWDREISKVDRAVEVLQLLARPLQNLSIEPSDELTAEHRFRILGSERPDHGPILTRNVINVKR